MSSTRKAEDGEAKQERYMSAPQYAESWGLRGHLVAARASLLQSPKERSLLFFLQALSCRPGGLGKVATELHAMFPERVGTKTMHAQGMKPGTVYERGTASAILLELGEIISDDDKINLPHRRVEHLLQQCRDRAGQLGNFLQDLCLNPAHKMDKEEADWPFWEVWHFKGILAALYEYQRRFADAVEADFTLTEIGRQVFATLDFGLRCNGMVVVEGYSRVGKSASTKAWCEQHLGEARYVTLKDVKDDGSFFRCIAKALGLPCTFTRKAIEMRDRIEDMLVKSGLLLVLDEAHYLWNHSQRVSTLPHRINWILTALCNEGVPIALVTTPQFAWRRSQVETQTGWSSEQLAGRIKRYRKLPIKPSQADLRAVAKKLLPGADSDTLDLLVANAMQTGNYMTGVVNTIEEARYEAELQGRSQVTFEDVEKVFEAYVLPSHVAQQAPPTGRKTRVRPCVAPALPEEEKPIAKGLQADGNDTRKSPMDGVIH